MKEEYLFPRIMCATVQEYPELTELWEASVRSTQYPILHMQLKTNKV